MLNEETRTIVTRLLEKTKAKGVPWEEFEDVSSSDDENVRFSLPTSTVVMWRTKLTGRIEFRLINGSGVAALSATVGSSDKDHALFNELVSLAVRQARRVDESISEINRFLER